VGETTGLDKLICGCYC